MACDIIGCARIDPRLTCFRPAFPRDRRAAILCLRNLRYEDNMNLELPSDLARKTPVELTGEYLAWRRRYRDLVKRAERVSRGSGGVYVQENRLAYAAVLFTRIAVMAKTISQLLPDCKPRDHWDFSSVASLTRNLAEAYLWYFWLCEDDVAADVRQARFILLYCHDNGSRGKMLGHEIDISSSDVVMSDLIERFDNNPHLKTYSEKARREALKGQKAPFIQDDVLSRMGIATEKFRLVYRFFSQHTHTGPVSYFRMVEHDRGTGVETAQEKRYMIFAISFACALLEGAIGGHLKIFPDAETLMPHLTASQIVKQVERNQGRGKSKKR